MDKNQVRERFSKQFWNRPGTLEGDDIPPVQIIALYSSWQSTAAWSKGFGCPVGIDALLVEYIPAEISLDARQSEHLPKGRETIGSKAIPLKQPAVFPRSYEGMPVYYRRGRKVIFTPR